MKKKLFDLKKWLTIEDTARHLSILFDESVTESDVLRLGLDGNLVLSLNFVNDVSVKIGRAIPINEAKMYVMSSDFRKQDTLIENVTLEEIECLPEEIKAGLDDGSLKIIPMGDVINKDEVIQYSEKIEFISGVWDLPMIGGERIEIEHVYQLGTDGLAVTSMCISGSYVKSDNGEFANIQMSNEDNEYIDGSRANIAKLKREMIAKKTPAKKVKVMLEQFNIARDIFLKEKKSNKPSENYRTTSQILDVGVLVVRTSSLRQFGQSLSDDQTRAEKKLTSNERNSLLVIIAALCDHSKIDPNKRGAAVQIAKLTEAIGAPVSNDTILRAIEKLTDAVESRMR